MAKAPAKKTAPNKTAPQQAVAVVEDSRPLTKPEQNKRKMAAMLEGVSNSRADLESLLRPQGIDFDFFRSALQVALMTALKNDPDFFSVTADSFFTAVYKAANDGLVCDGREAAIVRFAAEATYMPMVPGMVKKAHQSGMILSINYNVVTEQEDAAGRFEYEEGTDGFIRHKPLMTRKDTDTIVAAYAVVKTVGGGEYREVVPKADLDKIRSVSRATKGPRKDWPLEMDRKAPMRRVFKRIPHDRGLAQLMQHDDEAYARAPRLGTADPDKPQVSTTALFAATAEHKAQPAEEQRQDEQPVEDPKVEEVKTVADEKPKRRAKPADPKTAPNQSAIVDEMMKKVKAAETPGDLAEAIHELSTHPRRGDLTKTSEKIVAQAIRDQQEKLGMKPKPKDDHHELLVAIMRTGGSEKQFETATIWRDDILNKMASISGADLKTFWSRNETFIRRAHEAGIPEAERVLAVAKHKGLIQ